MNSVPQESSWHGGGGAASGRAVRRAGPGAPGTCSGSRRAAAQQAVPLASLRACLLLLRAALRALRGTSRSAPAKYFVENFVLFKALTSDPRAPAGCWRRSQRSRARRRAAPGRYSRPRRGPAGEFAGEAAHHLGYSGTEARPRLRPPRGRPRRAGRGRSRRRVRTLAPTPHHGPPRGRPGPSPIGQRRAPPPLLLAAAAVCHAAASAQV